MTATRRLVGHDIGWLIQAACPADTRWLGPREAAVLAGLRVARRRDEWLLGRWAAKRALIAGGLAGAPHEVEIVAAGDGAPEPWVGPRRLEASLSISHRAGMALAVVSARVVPLGCDIELVEPRSAAFVRDYFTGAERALLATAPPGERTARTVLVWSAKEAALKALRTGLRRDTRSVEVSWPAQPALARAGDTRGDHVARGWRPVSMDDVPTGRRFLGRWCAIGAHLLTVAIEAYAHGDRAPDLVELAE